YTEAANSSAPLDFQLKTIRVDIDSEWLNKTVNEVKELAGYQILLVKRNGVTFPPREEYHIRQDDELAVYREGKNS
ncbi:MAG: TrkA C-terminal domain-containing protein, partial [Solobacterium sp.]|nr:TrkA C-terminal domain-containing protein [Solobacterium sp.]